MTIGLQPPLAYLLAYNSTATPSWVQLGLRGRSCLWGWGDGPSGDSILDDSADIEADEEKRKVARWNRAGITIFLTHISPRTIYRWIEAGKVHFAETQVAADKLIANC